MVLGIDGEDVGMIVDGVAEVLRVPGGRVEQPPLSEVNGVRNDIIEGIANLGERLIVLFDVDRILSEGPEGEPERDGGMTPARKASIQRHTAVAQAEVSRG